jgi:lipopolysaccharide biosynthesis protein
LRLPDVQARQVELAANYGLAGFCFHYYWFAGRKLLDRPLNQFLENKALDFGFCISWANENWTRSWDGLDKEILVKQRHSPQDDIDFIREMEPLFRDERYIRVAGRPLLLVYRVSQLPDPAGTAERWRKWCIKAGLGNPYLAFVRFDDTDPTLLGFDAAVEFPPHKIGGRLPPINSKLRFFHKDYQGTVLSYDGMVQRALTESVPSYPLLRGVSPGWDNEARRSGKGLCFYGSTPPKYQAWLESACRYADEHPVEGERLVFVNAWNEWAEGAYIEPDRSFGYAYLDATRSALRQCSKA